ncbi:MAG: PKD domain-containing protein [Thermoplasmata archaeon]|nr:PKD domain-containing protein [Thermoplasmata archaeon]
MKALFVSLIVVASSFAMALPAGIWVNIDGPENNSLLHYRHIYVNGSVTACCNDKIVKWGWTHFWNGGNESREYEVESTVLVNFSIKMDLWPGKNEITVYGVAMSGSKGYKTINLYYDGPVVIINGSYSAKSGEKIDFKGYAYGGTRPYNYTWHFGDGSVAYGSNVSHIYSDKGTYTVTFVVRDASGYYDEATTTVVIYEGEAQPPEISILKPMHGLYINDRKILPLPVSLIVGDITIEIDAKDEQSGVKMVSLYIDDRLVENITEQPYEYAYSPSLGLHAISAIAYDYAGNYAQADSVIFAI